MDKKIHWHQAFCAAMELELRDNREVLEYEREHLFNMEPLRADMLIIKKKPEVRIINEIGAIFRIWNIVEYKSPEDSMNIDDFYKACAYACLFKSSSEHVDEYPAEEITVSLIRRSYPKELLEVLGQRGFTVKQIYDGIYEICGNVMFKTQIIATRLLKGEQHAWLKSLTKGIRDDEFQSFADEMLQLRDKHEIECADAILEVVSNANIDIVNRWREDPKMCETLARIMEPEFSQAREEAMRQGRQEGIREGIKEGLEQGIYMAKRILRLEAQGAGVTEIAAEVGISEQEVRDILS